MQGKRGCNAIDSSISGKVTYFLMCVNIFLRKVTEFTILSLQGNIKLAEQFLAKIGTCLDEETTKQALEYKESDNAAASSFELSCIAPRGKHKIMIYEDRQEILIRNKNGAKVVLKCDEAGFYSAVKLDKKYLMVSHVASNFIYEKPNNKVQELNCICIAYDEDVASKIIDLLNISKIVDVSSSKGINAYYNRDMGKLCLVESHGLVFFKYVTDQGVRLTLHNALYCLI